MRRHADALKPAMRRRLARETDVPALHTLTEVLASYGPPAQAALPELKALLATPHRALACRVLGELGLDAAEAAEDLHRLAAAAARNAAARKAATSAWA